MNIYEGSTVVAGSYATTTEGAVGGQAAGGTNQAFLGAATTGNIFFRPTSARTINAGTSATYELRGAIAALATGSNYVDITIANPATAITTDTFATVAGTSGNDTSSFVWSDWSDVADHATSAKGSSTSDWADDYLLKTLPLNIGNKSVSL
jgi:hypothetical protein